MRILIKISEQNYRYLQKRIEMGIYSELDKIVYKGRIIPPNYAIIPQYTDEICKEEEDK